VNGAATSWCMQAAAGQQSWLMAPSWPLAGPRWTGSALVGPANRPGCSPPPGRGNHGPLLFACSPGPAGFSPPGPGFLARGIRPGDLRPYNPDALVRGATPSLLESPWLNRSAWSAHCCWFEGEPLGGRSPAGPWGGVAVSLSPRPFQLVGPGPLPRLMDLCFLLRRPRRGYSACLAGGAAWRSLGVPVLPFIALGPPDRPGPTERGHQPKFVRGQTHLSGHPSAALPPAAVPTWAAFPLFPHPVQGPALGPSCPCCGLARGGHRGHRVHCGLPGRGPAARRAGLATPLIALPARENPASLAWPPTATDRTYGAGFQPAVQSPSLALGPLPAGPASRPALARRPSRSLPLLLGRSAPSDCGGFVVRRALGLRPFATETPPCHSSKTSLACPRGTIPSSGRAPDLRADQLIRPP